jgi:hypothetical protein
MTGCLSLGSKSVRAVEGEVEAQHVDTGRAEEAQQGGGRVLGQDGPDPVLRLTARLRDVRHLMSRVPRADIRVRPEPEAVTSSAGMGTGAGPASATRSFTVSKSACLDGSRWEATEAAAL